MTMMDLESGGILCERVGDREEEVKGTWRLGVSGRRREARQV